MKINSKWLKYLNIQQDTIKLMEENIGKTFSDINHTHMVFLGQSLKTLEVKTKTNRRHNSLRLQTIVQSYSHQDSVALVQKQTYRPMEQNREPRNKPRHL